MSSFVTKTVQVRLPQLPPADSKLGWNIEAGTQVPLPTDPKLSAQCFRCGSPCYETDSFAVSSGKTFRLEVRNGVESIVITGYPIPSERTDLGFPIGGQVSTGLVRCCNACNMTVLGMPIVDDVRAKAFEIKGGPYHDFEAGVRADQLEAALGIRPKLEDVTLPPETIGGPVRNRTIVHGDDPRLSGFVAYNPEGN